jgi:hypothetical protein
MLRILTARGDAMVVRPNDMEGVILYHFPKSTVYGRNEMLSEVYALVPAAKALYTFAPGSSEGELIITIKNDTLSLPKRASSFNFVEARLSKEGLWKTY